MLDLEVVARLCDISIIPGLAEIHKVIALFYVSIINLSMNFWIKMFCSLQEMSGGV
jgi:hypothetical protein